MHHKTNIMAVQVENPLKWHLPDVLEPGDPLPEIPCLCEPNHYDKEGFFDFPTRQGWFFNFAGSSGPERINRDEVPSSAQKGAFLQSWLFFGTMYEVFRLLDVEIELEDCVIRDQDGTRRCVTTYPLRKYFANFTQNEKCRRKIPRRVALTDIAKILKHVDWIVRRYSDTFSPRTWMLSETLSLDIVISILILGESLLNMARLAERIPDNDQSMLWGVGFAWARNPLEQRMLGAGWCISTTAMLHTLLDATGLYYASRLRFPSYSSRQSHSNCTAQQCFANHVDESTYQTQHIEQCRGCEHISIDVEKVAEVIAQGKTPIVYINYPDTDSGYSDIQLEVVTSTPYIAISHVWAQGLGNAHANSLPSCQLAKIKRMVSGIHPMNSEHSAPQLGVWMDTLCIPVAPHLKALRKLSIARLEETYRNAEQILVVDKDLMGASRLASRIEKATRLLCSAWMRRLWTYQEAVVSNLHPNCEKLQIQFSDGPVTFHSLCTNPTSLCHSEMAINSLLLALPLTGSVSFMFSTLSRALRYRTTSRQSDEAICLTAVLGHDVSKVIATNNTEERMAIFYSFIDSVPAEIIFQKTPRLQIGGYRWAPLSFLQQTTQIAVTKGLDAPRDAHGVYVNFPALQFLSIGAPKNLGNHFVLGEDPENPTIRLSSAGAKSGRTDEEWRRVVRGWEEFDRAVLKSGEIALILNPDPICPDALVSVLRKEPDGTRYCRFLCLAETSTVHATSLEVCGRVAIAKIDAGATWCVG
ncbi:hypothetical protein L873DRAFT_1834398 [Choiromyces venosus 120613-1]|uniref:Heterokaryon incompatibility domain-containing protein n=1 Tax=Choiromyces venosus 120613-1 TaxID=1336337 RepID=A0A3N4JYK5_9PEZI|nr:hypothetical protein L873DRAFT_1834398 [Choiromyces venosus 120613-1]